MGACKARQVLIDLKKDFLEFLESLDYLARQACQGYLGKPETGATHCQNTKREK